MARSPEMSDLSSRRGFLRTAAAGGMLASIGASAAAQAQPSPAPNALPFLLPRDFGAVGDGQQDDAAAIQRLVDAGIAQGRPIFMPAGRYLLGRPILIRIERPTAEIGSLAAGPKLYGAGAGLTVFETRFDAGAALDLDTAVDHRAVYRAAFGAHFEGFTITGQGGASGLRLRTAANVTLRGLHIVGLGGTGVEIVCQAGDNDASNMMTLDQVRIENVRGWGLDTASGDGFNEISFLALLQVFFQNCGTAARAADAPPASGGMRWKGQICMLEQCAFTLNRNVGLFVEGQAGLAQSLELRGTVFENNYGRHLLCTGISGLKGRNLQFYSRGEYPVRVACELDGRGHTIRNVDLDGVVVRARADNADMIAFRISGAHAELANCRVRNVIWENFDHPGQRRFDGFVFDDVRQCCVLRRVSPNEIAFGTDPAEPRGNRSPVRRGGASGEWSEVALISDLVLSNDGLAPERTYWIYLFDNNGWPRLEASLTAPVVDRASGYGVRPDDRSRLAVGSVRTDARSEFAA